MIEYADPAHPEWTLCAPELNFQGTVNGRDVFEEQPAYRPDECPLGTLQISSEPGAPEKLNLDKYVAGDNAACCHGTVTQTSDQRPSDPAPDLPALKGFDGPLNSVGLDTPTTQYSAADGQSAYFPNQGVVIVVPLTTGEESVVNLHTDVSNPYDPHAVAIVDVNQVWIARGPEKRLERVDNAPHLGSKSPIQLEHSPYALAVDGTNLWVTSLEDNVVMRVNTLTGKTEATISVPGPTGIAFGGASVWVVEHDASKLARIDPLSNALTKEVDVPEDPQNVIFAFGDPWIASNLGRSVSRVSAIGMVVTTIPLEHRAWSIAAGANEVYASQFEEIDGYVDQTVGGFAQINPQSYTAKQVSAPGVRGVAVLGDQLWLIVPTSLSDWVLSYRPR